MNLVIRVHMLQDHKPENKIESARITRAGGWVSRDGRVNGNLNLSRAIGDRRYKLNKDLLPEQQIITANPDIVVQSRDPADDYLLIACDGIWNSMTNVQAVDFINKRLIQGFFFIIIPLFITEKLYVNILLITLCLIYTGLSPTVIANALLDACMAPSTSGDGRFERIKFKLR